MGRILIAREPIGQIRDDQKQTKKHRTQTRRARPRDWTMLAAVAPFRQKAAAIRLRKPPLSGKVPALKHCFR
jgi:hypothetical protein